MNFFYILFRTNGYRYSSTIDNLSISKCFLLFSIHNWFYLWFKYCVYYDNAMYAYYSFTHASLAELKTTLANGCSNLIDLPCSLQMNINVYFFWSKFVILYYLSIIIMMTYIWHRTVHFSHCVITFFVLADIIFVELTIK
jgi:hypothetical protein